MAVSIKTTEAKTSELFGARLRELSDSRGSYSQIARELGINRQQFARYLNGTSLPRDALVRKIAEYFGVEPGVLFQPTPIADQPVRVDGQGDPTSHALMAWAGRIKTDPISEKMLPSGLYLHYKQSFTQHNKVAVLMCRIYRSEDGAVHCKRHYSAKVRPNLLGLDGPETSYGVFARVLGMLVLFDLDGMAGDLVLTSFKAPLALSPRVRAGIVLTQGRPSNLGPMSGRHLLEQVPQDASPFAWGRRQGFHHVSDLPDYIQYHFAPVSGLTPDIMAVR